MTAALCPGSFDPPTNGHVDVINRCLSIFDRVVVGVVHNPSKSPLFPAEQRVSMLQEVFAGVPNLEIESFEGLLVDFAEEHGVDVIVKGLRAVTDFDYELQMAQMNFTLAGVDTLFVATNPAYGYLSSSLVKEVVRLGGSVDEMVPAPVAAAIKERLES